VGDFQLIELHCVPKNIDVNKRFYVFYFGHVFTFLTLFISSTFFVYKNVDKTACK